MSYREALTAAHFRHENEISGSTNCTLPQDQRSDRGTGGEDFRISTPTRSQERPAFFDGERSLPGNYQSGYPPTNGALRNNHTIECGSYSAGGYGTHGPSASVLLSDEVISGSLTNGNRMS